MNLPDLSVYKNQLAWKKQGDVSIVVQKDLGVTGQDQMDRFQIEMHWFQKNMIKAADKCNQAEPRVFTLAQIDKQSYNFAQA